MERLPNEKVAEINALAGMDARMLHRRYREILADMPNCHNSGVLRAVIAYRIQERYYGITLPEDVRNKLDGSADGGSRLVPHDRPILAGTRLIRNWKGKEHEVTVREDGHFEYQGESYKSLSAIARKITGTQWNGKLFFGVKR